VTFSLRSRVFLGWSKQRGRVDHKLALGIPFLNLKLTIQDVLPYIEKLIIFYTEHLDTILNVSLLLSSYILYKNIPNLIQILFKNNENKVVIIERWKKIFKQIFWFLFVFFLLFFYFDFLFSQFIIFKYTSIQWKRGLKIILVIITTSTSFWINKEIYGNISFRTLFSLFSFIISIFIACMYIFIEFDTYIKFQIISLITIFTMIWDKLNINSPFALMHLSGSIKDEKLFKVNELNKKSHVLYVKNEDPSPVQRTGDGSSNSVESGIQNNIGSEDIITPVNTIQDLNSKNKSVNIKEEKSLERKRSLNTKSDSKLIKSKDNLNNPNSSRLQLPEYRMRNSQHKWWWKHRGITVLFEPTAEQVNQNKYIPEIWVEEPEIGPRKKYDWEIKPEKKNNLSLGEENYLNVPKDLSKIIGIERYPHKPNDLYIKSDNNTKYDIDQNKLKLNKESDFSLDDKKIGNKKIQSSQLSIIKELFGPLRTPPPQSGPAPQSPLPLPPQQILEENSLINKDIKEKKRVQSHNNIIQKENIEQTELKKEKRKKIYHRHRPAYYTQHREYNKDLKRYPYLRQPKFYEKLTDLKVNKFSNIESSIKESKRISLIPKSVQMLNKKEDVDSIWVDETIWEKESIVKEKEDTESIINSDSSGSMHDRDPFDKEEFEREWAEMQRKRKWENWWYELTNPLRPLWTLEEVERQPLKKQIKELILFLKTDHRFEKELVEDKTPMPPIESETWKGSDWAFWYKKLIETDIDSTVKETKVESNESVSPEKKKLKSILKKRNNDNVTVIFDKQFKDRQKKWDSWMKILDEREKNKKKLKSVKWLDLEEKKKILDENKKWNLLGKSKKFIFNKFGFSDQEINFNLNLNDSNKGNSKGNEEALNLTGTPTNISTLFVDNTELIPKDNNEIKTKAQISQEALLEIDNNRPLGIKAIQEEIKANNNEINENLNDINNTEQNNTNNTNNINETTITEESLSSDNTSEYDKESELGSTIVDDKEISVTLSKEEEIEAIRREPVPGLKDDHPGWLKRTMTKRWIEGAESRWEYREEEKRWQLEKKREKEEIMLYWRRKGIYPELDVDLAGQLLMDDIYLAILDKSITAIDYKIGLFEPETRWLEHCIRNTIYGAVMDKYYDKPDAFENRINMEYYKQKQRLDIDISKELNDWDYYKTQMQYLKGKLYEKHRHIYMRGTKGNPHFIEKYWDRVEDRKITWMQDVIDKKSVQKEARFLANDYVNRMRIRRRHVEVTVNNLIVEYYLRNQKKGTLDFKLFDPEKPDYLSLDIMKRVCEQIDQIKEEENWKQNPDDTTTNYRWFLDKSETTFSEVLKKAQDEWNTKFLKDINKIEENSNKK
jgi:hypothetical protein